MIGKFFAQKAELSCVDFLEFCDFLELDRRLRNDPGMHIKILSALGEYSLRGSTQQGPAKSCFSDITKTLTMEPEEIAFSGGQMTGPETYNVSSYVATTEEPAAFGNKIFSMVIRKGSDKPDELGQALVFGLRGKVDKQGDLIVTKILAPDIRDGALTGVQEMEVNDDHVTVAMVYARECLNRIYAGLDVMPLQALERTTEIMAAGGEFYPDPPGVD